MTTVLDTKLFNDLNECFPNNKAPAEKDLCKKIISIGLINTNKFNDIESLTRINFNFEEINYIYLIGSKEQNNIMFGKLNKKFNYNIDIDKINIEIDDTDIDLKSQQFIKYLNTQFNYKNIEIESEIKKILTPTDRQNLTKGGNYNKLRVLFPSSSYSRLQTELAEEIKPVDISYTVNNHEQQQSFTITDNNEVFAGFAKKYYKYKLKYLILKKLIN